MSSKESLSFEDRQAKKRERRRREELRNFTIGVFVAGAVGFGLHNVGIIDNPFELHQDTSVSVEDGTLQDDIQK